MPIRSVSIVRHGTLALALMLGACAAQVEPPVVEYGEKYPIGIRSETVAMTLPFGPVAASSADDEQRRFAGFVAGYLDRSHGPLTVVAPAEPTVLRARLIAAGIPPGSINAVVSTDGAEDTLVLRYERYVATLPQCGDWSGPAGFDPLNRAHSNFGCAAQANMGAMAADPADLVRMREASPTDAQNANRVIRRYRAGEPPAAIPTPLQNSGAAGTTSSR